MANYQLYEAYEIKADFLTLLIFTAIRMGISDLKSATIIAFRVGSNSLGYQDEINRFFGDRNYQYIEDFIKLIS